MPRPPESQAGCSSSSFKKKSTSSLAAARAEPGASVVSRIERRGPSAQRGTGEAALVATASAVPTSTLLVTGAALQVAPNILSIAHWDRLLCGALYAPLSRVDWATILRRSFNVDVTHCTGCAGDGRARSHGDHRLSIQDMSRRHGDHASPSMSSRSSPPPSAVSVVACPSRRSRAGLGTQALDKRPPSSSDRGISATSCSAPRPRAVLLRVIPHYVGLLSTTSPRRCSTPIRSWSASTTPSSLIHA